MQSVRAESRSTTELLEEIAHLKADVARLEEKCGELDRLAHLDPLVPIANRRGMLRELETMIARHERFGSPGGSAVHRPRRLEDAQRLLWA